MNAAQTTPKTLSPLSSPLSGFEAAAAELDRLVQIALASRTNEDIDNALKAAINLSALLGNERLKQNAERLLTLSCEEREGAVMRCP